MGALPVATNSPDTSRMSTAAPRWPRSDMYGAQATTVWSIAAGRDLRTDDAMSVNWRQCRSPLARISQSSSTQRYFTT